MTKIFKQTGMMLFMCLLAMLSLTTGVQAQESYSITINNDQPGHTYQAYQIFSGRLQTTDRNETTLSDIVWGSGVNGKDLQTALKKVSAFSSIQSASDAAKVLDQKNSFNLTKEFVNTAADHLSAPAAVSKNVNGAYIIDGLSAGYYLIKDQDESLNGYDAYSEYMIKVVGDVSMKPKTGLPAMIKKIVEYRAQVDDKVDAAFPNLLLEDNENDTAGFFGGEDLAYRLMGTLPQNYASYKTYKYIFHDSMTKAFTPTGSFSVRAILPDGEEEDITSFFKKQTRTTDRAVETDFVCEDLKAAGISDANTMIVVKYYAKASGDFNVGIEGNKNTGWLEYSNNPNPGHEQETGQTPPDTCVAFTYALQITKVDKDKPSIKLKNAQFKLKSPSGLWIAADENGKVTNCMAFEDQATVFKTDENGQFTISGLDNGPYTLIETLPPAGYSSHPDSIRFRLKSNLKHTQNYDGSTASHTSLVDSVRIITDSSESSFGGNGLMAKLTVADTRGSILPETGGQGSAAIIGFGLILAAAGAAYFVLRKKPAHQQ